MEDKRSVTIIIMIFGGILLLTIILGLTSNPSNKGSNTTPSVTPSISTEVIFSGFSSNISLEDFSFSNISALASIAVPQSRYYFNVYDIGNSYISSKLGAYLPGKYNVVNEGNIVAINSNLAQASGSITGDDAVSAVKNFIQNDLGLVFTGGEQVNYQVNNTAYSTFNVYGSISINGVSVYNIDGKNQFSAIVSSGGGIESMTLEGVFISPVNKGNVLPYFPDMSSPSSTNAGVYITDSTSAENISYIYNSPIQIVHPNLGYYFDTGTGNIIPILFLQCNVNLIDSSKSFNVNIMFPLIQHSEIIDVPPSPTPSLSIQNSMDNLGN